MPSIWTLDLAVPPSAALTPERLHAIMCTLVDTDESHRSSMKAFSVRPPEPRIGDIVSIRLGLLDDDLINLLGERLQARRGRVAIGPAEGAVTNSRLHTMMSWEELADRAEPIDRVDLRFLSPTFFRRGNTAHLLPQPSIVFGSWRARWREIHGRVPECKFDDASMHVRRLDVRTQIAELRGEQRAGIVGDVSIDISALPSAERAAIDAFASLAPFAGCGAYTTSTFGATDRLAVP